MKVKARNVQQEKRIMRAVVASLDPMDPGLKLKPEYRRKHESGCDPTTGFCSVATEAVWAMLGGNEAGYERRQVRHQGDSHWFVEDVATGRFLDPTSTQFSSPVPYEKGVGRGIPVALLQASSNRFHSVPTCVTLAPHGTQEVPVLCRSQGRRFRRCWRALSRRRRRYA